MLLSTAFQQCEADRMYVDGTFQTCPRLFYQIFSCHIFKHGKQFPVVYAFLPAKSRATYERMFTLIQDKADSMQLNFSPETMVADFELAIKQAIQLTFPTASFKGCYYHFCQALMRKIQDPLFNTSIE